MTAAALPARVLAFEAVAVAAREGGAAERLALVERLEPMIQRSAKSMAAIALRRGIRSLDLEDLQQEGRRLVLEQLPMWEPGRGSALAFFSFTVRAKVQELLYWTLRHAPGGMSVDQDPALARQVENISGAADVAFDELDAELKLALLQLNAGWRYILYRFYWLDEDDAQVGEALGMRGVDVQQRRYRALRQLRKSLSPAKS